MLASPPSLSSSPPQPPPPPSPTKRRPCDRCHRLKEKCRWPCEELLSSCQRCGRLRLECTSNRPIGKAGRKPRLASGNRMSLRRAPIMDPVPPKRCINSATSPQIKDARSRSSSVKTESVVSSPSSDSTLTTPVHLSSAAPELCPHVSLLPDLSRLEMYLLDATLHKQMQVDKYIIGPSFRDQHLQSFVDHLDTGLPHLKDAFIACATVLVGDEHLQKLAVGQHIGFKRAAAAVASLRSSTVTIHRDHDLTVILILGVAMITFAFHNAAAAPEPLCRYVLGLVKTSCRDRQSLKRRLGDNGIAFLICLLGTETESCLINCQVPTLQIRNYEIGQCVDRFIGISLPMFAYFYDICALAHGIREAKVHGRWRLSPEAQSRIQELELSIEKWQLDVPTDFLAGRYAPAEVMLMLAQSRILRLAALLILHRLQHTYGTQDGKAVIMAKTILSELGTVLCLAGRSVPFSDLPHLAACFEITSPADRIDQLARSDSIVDFSPHVLAEHKEWLVSFWTARDNCDGRDGIYWDDVQTHIRAS